MGAENTNPVQNANVLPQIGVVSNGYIEVKIKDSPKDWTDNAKLASELLGPFVAFVLGLLVLRLTNRLAQGQWRNQKLIEKRIEVWDEIGPVVNDIYCYCFRVGGWKKFTPPEIIDKKREADKLVHLNRPYFSDDFYKIYCRFINSCFEHYQGHGVDAKLKTPLWEHQNAHKPWDSAWDKLFFETATEEEIFQIRYNDLLHQVSLDLNPKV